MAIIKIKICFLTARSAVLGRLKGRGEEGKGTRVKEAKYLESSHVKLIYYHARLIRAFNYAT